MTREEDDANDDLLVKAVGGGDRAAFGELVKRHHAKVRSLLNFLTRDSALADDLAQQAFLRAWEKLSSFRGDTSARFGAWLARIAYREFLQRVRRGKREQRLFSSAHAVEEQPDQAGEHFSQPFTDAAWAQNTGLAEHSATPSMAQLLQPCSREQSEVLYMNFVLELTHEEIAVVTSTPLGTVKSHISRGKAAIRASLLKAGQTKLERPEIDRTKRSETTGSPPNPGVYNAERT